MEEKKCTNVNCNTILTPKQIETNNKYCCHRCYLTDENKPPPKRKPIRGKRDGTGHPRRLCKFCKKRFRSKIKKRYCSFECAHRKYKIDVLDKISDKTALILGYLWNSAYISHSNKMKVYNTLEVVNEIQELMGAKSTEYKIGKARTYKTDYYFIVYEGKLVENLFNYGMSYESWFYYGIPLISEIYWNKFIEGLLKSGEKYATEKYLYIRLINREICRFCSEIKGYEMSWYMGGWCIMIEHNQKNTTNYNDIWNSIIGSI